MSQQITEAFVKQYSSNVFHLSQQKGSRLQPFVRNERQRGESKFFERLGTVAAQLRTSRHADTPQIDTPHSRRRVTLSDYEWADLIDDQDRIRTLIDPTSPYAQAAMWGFGRSKDDVILAAGLGNAAAGKEGATNVALPNTQKLAANAGAAVHTNLNVLTLRRAKKIFDANDVDEAIPRYIAVTASQLEALLGETEVTSSDFNTVKALVRGEIDTFLGFRFIRLERVLVDAAGGVSFDTDGTVGAGAGSTAANSRRVMAWAQDGVVLSTGMEVKARITERPDKSFSTQVYAAMGIGSVRLEEEKVVEIFCNEA